MEQVDGRIIGSNDAVKGLFCCKDVLVFVNEHNHIRICIMDQMVVDFDELVEADSLEISKNRITIIDTNNVFKIYDHSGNLLFEDENVIEYEENATTYVLTVLCCDGVKRKKVVSSTGEILVDVSNDFEEFKINERGYLFTQRVDQFGELTDNGQEFGHGFAVVLDTMFVGDYTFVYGVNSKGKTSTAIYLNGEPKKEIAYFGGMVRVMAIKNGNLLIEVEYKRHKDTYLYDKGGNLLEKFLDNSGKIELGDNYILCVNKQGYCRLYNENYEIIYDYKEKYVSAFYDSENLFGACERFKPQKYLNSIFPYTFEVDLLDVKGVIPKFYLKNTYYIYGKNGFIILCRVMLQDDDSLYFNTVVFNKDGRLVCSRNTVAKDSKATVLEVCPKVYDSAVGFKSDNGTETFYDAECNEYKYQPIITGNNEIFLIVDGNLITYSLPSMSKDEVAKGRHSSVSKSLVKDNSL